MDKFQHDRPIAVIEQIPAEQLDQIILKKLYRLIDVRDSKSIESQGSLPGAIHIPFENFETAMDRSHPEFNAVFNDKGPFLFCCTGGVMSYMAAIKAQNIGIQNVFNLEGGHSGWKKSKQTLAEI